jgi:hypothetical protein
MSLVDYTCGLQPQLQLLFAQIQGCRWVLKSEAAEEEMGAHEPLTTFCFLHCLVLVIAL